MFLLYLFVLLSLVVIIRFCFLTYVVSKEIQFDVFKGKKVEDEQAD